MKCILALALAFAIPNVSNAQAGPVGAPGRFVIVHSPHTQRDVMLLDTATGKTWQLQTDPSRMGEPSFWVPMSHVDDAAQTAQFLRDYPLKASPAPKP